MTDYLEKILQNLQANVDIWRDEQEAQAAAGDNETMRDGQEVSGERRSKKREHTQIRVQNRSIKVKIQLY